MALQPLPVVGLPHKTPPFIRICRLKSGNVCYLLVQNLLSTSLPSKNLKMKVYRTIILHVVLYGCETWSITLRKERRLRVFEHRVLRRIFEPKREQVTGKWRKLHNDQLNDLYCSPSIVRVIKLYCGYSDERSNSCRDGV